MNPDEVETVFQLDLSALDRTRLEAITNHVLNLIGVNDMLNVLNAHGVHLAAQNNIKGH